MQAKPGNNNWATDVIVSRVVDVLQVEGSEYAAPHMRRVVALLDRFTGVTERSISQ